MGEGGGAHRGVGTGVWPERGCKSAWAIQGTPGKCL